MSPKPVKGPTVTTYDELRYNQVRARGSHNSYQRFEDIADQLVFWRLRHVELDLHTSRNHLYPFVGLVPEAAPDGEWWVYHVEYAFEDPSVQKFSDGLKLLAGFHKAVPDHEVVTVALDIKNQFDSTLHTPEKLDALIARYLPGLVFTPADLIKGAKGATTLRDAAGKWPLLKDVRGKFIFICTTGNLSPGSQLSGYVAKGAKDRTCFVAPEISTVDQITSTQNADAVFFNMTVANAPTLAPRVFAAGFISRAYGANNQTAFVDAEVAQAHLIGTDNANSDVDPWSRTHNVHGWPFSPIGLTIPLTLVEPGTIYQVTVQSGDIYDSQDDFIFYHGKELALTSKQVVTYTYAVAVPSSHTANKNGKAGLMARAGLGRGAANFSVLRVADENEPRVQVRKKAGAGTDQYKLSNSTGISSESWMFVRLKLSNGGLTAEGFTSYDGTTWVSLHVEKFDKPLTQVGLACSSHDKGKSLRYDFIPVPAGGGIELTGLTRIGTVAMPPSSARRGLNLP